MSLVRLVLVALTCSTALISLGGGVYEVLVVDPAWPRRPELIQPQRGGLRRSRFWIPAHSAFEVLLVIALAATWPASSVRIWLLVALVSHLLMRAWSFVDFIPKALAFESAEPSDVRIADARRWSRRSLGRLPLDMAACGAAMTALVILARPG